MVYPSPITSRRMVLRLRQSRAQQAHMQPLFLPAVTQQIWRIMMVSHRQNLWILKYYVFCRRWHIRRRVPRNNSIACWTLAKIVPLISERYFWYFCTFILNCLPSKITKESGPICYSIAEAVCIALLTHSSGSSASHKII